MRKAHGMTLVGMLFTMAVVIIIGVLIMRVTPAYVEYYSVTSSVNSLNSMPKDEFSLDSSLNSSILRKSLIKRLDINGINNVKSDNIKIIPNGINNFTVTVKYEVQKPLVSNMSLLFNFDVSQEVSVGPK